MSEPQPPLWWQPPAERRFPARPTRPVYRERRPVRWWTVLLGLGGAVVWFALVAIASRGSTPSIVVGLLIGAAVACLVVWVLAWKGDVGLSVGVGMVAGLTISVIVFIAYVSALSGGFSTN